MVVTVRRVICTYTKIEYCTECTPHPNHNKNSKNIKILLIQSNNTTSSMTDVFKALSVMSKVVTKSRVLSTWPVGGSGATIAS